jgi:TonB family protein
MGRWLLIASLLFCCPTFAQDKSNSAGLLQGFEVSLHTYFDFGPPFDFYQLYSVRPTVSGTFVERITLTPTVNQCLDAGTAKVESGTMTTPLEELLAGVSPCSISEKKLRREVKRCKHCLVFSGAEITMRVKCGSRMRIINVRVLDRDWFDRNARTPENTSWSMALLERLDHAVGSSVMNTPVFDVGDGNSHVSQSFDEVAQDLERGVYDPLFSDSKISDLYRTILETRPSTPSVTFNGSIPFQSDALSLPAYPPIARAANIEGLVIIKGRVREDGQTTSVEVVSGHPLLASAVVSEANRWKFSPSHANEDFHASVEFKLNCSRN